MFNEDSAVVFTRLRGFTYTKPISIFLYFWEGHKLFIRPTSMVKMDYENDKL